MWMYQSHFVQSPVSNHHAIEVYCLASGVHEEIKFECMVVVAILMDDLIGDMTQRMKFTV